MAETVAGSVGVNSTFDLEIPGVGQGIPNAVFNGTISGANAYKSAIADAALGGASLQYGPTLTIIAASGNFTPTLAAMTDPLGQALNFFRVKMLLIELLSIAQDATNGTACSGISVGNAASNQALTGSGGLFGSAASIAVVNNGGRLLWEAGTAAGCVTGALVNLKILNNDGANSAAVRMTMYGGKA